jgi:hypothetical protein
MATSHCLGINRSVPEQLKVRELETWAHGASYKRVRSRGVRGLPPIGWDHMHWLPIIIEAPQNMGSHLLEVGIRREQHERIAFVEVPDFVGSNSVPSAHLSGGEQEVDGRERRTLGPLIGRVHARGGAVHLSEVAAFRMRGQPK